MSAWVVTMGAGATMGSCIRRLPFHRKERLGPKSITWASEMAKHNSGDALSIVMKLSSPYAHKDEVVFLEDGRWLMLYSPRAGGLNHSDNRALVRCMEERIPIGIFKQLTGKTDRYYGSTYCVLGLGLITSYDSKADIFVVESADSSALEQVSSVITDEESRYEVQLYAQLTNEFRPFVS